MKSRRRLSVALAALIAIGGAGSLPGCAAVCGVDARGSVSIMSSPDTNLGNAIAVDVVAVRNEALAAQLSVMTATEYFIRRDDILGANPTTLDVAGWEIAPGQAVEQVSVTFECGVDGVFIFASYQTEGEHRVRLLDLDDVVVSLGPETLTVTQ